MTALLEFLVNPTIGRLADAYGRRPFMIVAPYAAIVLKTWVLLKPSLLSLTVEKIVCDGLRTLSGTTMGSAAITDLVPSSQLGKAFSKLWSYMGIAIIASPLLASRMSAKTAYVAAILLATVQLAADQMYLRETLPEAKRKPFQGYASPLDVGRLFTASARCRIATSITVLQNMLDVKILADPLYVLQSGLLEWTRQQTQVFSAVLGMGLVVGRKITAATMENFGLHGHTTLTHCVAVLQNLVIGLFPSSVTMALAGLMGWVGDQKGHAVKQFATNAALSTGQFGKGELSGLQANLRALCVSIGPFLYAAAYSRGVKIGRPGSAMLVAAAICVGAELAHQQLIAHDEKAKGKKEDKKIGGPAAA